MKKKLQVINKEVVLLECHGRTCHIVKTFKGILSEKEIMEWKQYQAPPA